MEFIKKMKAREFIEMTLKTCIALFLAFIAVILMECMLYGIKFNSLKNYKGSLSKDTEYGVAYCMEDGTNKDGETVYFVIVRITSSLPNEPIEYGWTASQTKYTKDEINEFLKPQVNKVVYQAPSAFDLVVKPWHYPIMIVFIAGVSSYFVYKFIKLSKTYKEIEDNYNKTGVIEISNV